MSLFIEFIFGDNFVIALTEKGQLFSWGCNEHGELGIGHFNDICVPTKISALSQQEVIDVACGSADVIVLCKNNSVRTNQILAVIDNVDIDTMRMRKIQHTIVFLKVYTWGDRSKNTPAFISVDGTKTEIKGITCSEQGLFYLTSNGKVIQNQF